MTVFNRPSRARGGAGGVLGLIGTSADTHGDFAEAIRATGLEYPHGALGFRLGVDDRLHHLEALITLGQLQGGDNRLDTVPNGIGDAGLTAMDVR
jgi:hypothetical protein